MTDIALALGGGGFRGIAHIGAIEQLKKEGFVITGDLAAVYCQCPANPVARMGQYGYAGCQCVVCAKE